MPIFISLLFSFLQLAPINLADADKHVLQLRFEDVRTSQGTLNIAFYKREHDFLSDDDVYTAMKVNAKSPVTSASIELPKGTYAIAVYQDLDGNDEMKKNFIGIPKEPVGLSRDAIKGMSKPAFEDAAFDVPSSTPVVIDLKHY